MQNNGKKKTLLLGWDGADWKVINPLIDQGLMPNMKKLIENGTISNLATLDPMYSPMLWSSIATGKRPYKHGVLGFMEPTPDGKSVRPVMSVSRKSKAIWNIYTQKGLKNHVVGWWPSHPAEHINGVMISNFFQNHVGKKNEPWPMAKGTVHPETEANHFAQFRVHPGELTANHIGMFVPDIASIDQKRDRRLFSVAKVTAHASSLHAAFTNIIRTKEWDFAALYLDAIDHYSHGFMKYHPPRRPHIPKEDYDLYKDVIVSGYRFHDMLLGRIMDLIDKDTTLMLISDHGFQPDHLRPRDIPNEPAGPAYEHNPLGIMAVMGPNIKKDHITYGASILDVTPTLLTVAGMPVGSDMDGKIVTGIFEEIPEINIIPSWEDVKGITGMIDDNNPLVKANSGEEAIKQLEDLGYIEKQEGNKPKRLQQTKDECQFNLARAYINGGKILNAIEILEALYKENNSVARYTFRLAACYQMMGRIKDARQLVEHLKDQEQYSGPVIDVMLGGILIAEKQPIKAIKLFKKAAKHLNANHAKINLQLARAYSMLKRWDDAKSMLKAELEYDPHSDIALYEMGKVLLTQKYFRESSEYFLKALGINFNHPQYHFQLGVALYKDGEYAASSSAFENAISIYPNNNKAIEYLIKIYENKEIDQVRANVLKAQFESEIKGTIYVVSGLPRSGTSMMMQMLEKGGLEIFTDKKRESDENNPKGYYEHEAVKSLSRNKKWIPQAKDKVVKVIVQLLHHLPANFNYKIIFMERDINEVLASQRKMLKRLGKQSGDDETYPLKVMETYKSNLKQAKSWASAAPNVEIMYIDYKKVINDPFVKALEVNDFFNYQLLPELMVKAVDTKLYREKLQ